MVKLIRETTEKISAEAKKDIMGGHKLSEIATLFHLIGSTKKDGKYLLVANVFGTFEEDLRRIPSDWRMFDDDTKKELRKIIENAAGKMVKVADSLEDNPDDLFEALADFAVGINDVSDKAEEISKRLPKAPSFEQLLKGE